MSLALGVALGGRVALATFGRGASFRGPRAAPFKCGRMKPWTLGHAQLVRSGRRVPTATLRVERTVHPAVDPLAQAVWVIPRGTDNTPPPVSATGFIERPRASLDKLHVSIGRAGDDVAANPWLTGSKGKHFRVLPCRSESSTCKEAVHVLIPAPVFAAPWIVGPQGYHRYSARRGPPTVPPGIPFAPNITMTLLPMSGNPSRAARLGHLSASA